MSIVVGLPPELAEKEFAIGDSVRIQILIDEKIGSSADKWTFVSEEGKRWLPSGGFAVDTASLKALDADSTLTKLEFKAIVHSKNSPSIGPLNVRHLESGREFPLQGQILGKVNLYKQAEQQIPWTLPVLPIGGWNTALLIVCGILLLSALFIGIRYALRRAGLRLTAPPLDARTRTIRALDELLSFAKKKNNLRLEDWKKFSFELAGHLRRFSDENFGLESSDLTDREFLDELRRHPKGRHHVEAVASILNRIEEVRYGTRELEIALIPSLVQSAKTYVERSYVAPSEDKGR